MSVLDLTSVPVQPTTNYQVPSSGGVHAVPVSGVFAAAPTVLDWRNYSVQDAPFNPQGVYIDNTLGAGVLTIAVYAGSAFVENISCPPGQWMHTPYPAVKGQVHQVTGQGQATLVFVDYPVLPFGPFSLSGSGGSVGILRASVALPAGASNNLNPSVAPPWPTGFGRLILTAGAGAANITGLLAGIDGQNLFIFNNDPVNNITLNNQNVGSAAANRFAYVADLVLTPGDGTTAVYDATIARWLLS